MDYLIHIATLAALYSLAVLGLNYAAGFTGLISLNHGAFLGIGAYAGAILLKDTGLSFPVALLLAGLLTGVVAFLLSFPLLRLKGDAFILVSFGFALITTDILLNWSGMTNGALGIRGIPYPEITVWTGNPKLMFLLIIIVMLVACTVFLSRILRSSYGVVMKAARESQLVTQIAGHDTDIYRRSVFVMSAVITGFAGVFLASFISVIDPFQFNYHVSILLLIMTILGGLGSLKGSLIGATLLILLPEALRFLGLPSSILAESQQILYGLALILLMIWRPVGLFGQYRL